MVYTFNQVFNYINPLKIITFAPIMATLSKKANTFLAVAVVIIVAGGFAYKFWNEKKYGAIGVNIGELAPEIELPDTDGNMIKLSSLRGNYVLVDFWAAWCRPCRQENPNLMLAYETYSRKEMKNGAGFQILSVSADENEQQWKSAIQKDLLRGPIHVSDLKGWASPVFADYGIHAIPSNVLLDPEGKVIAIKLRGKDLHNELEKLVD